MNGVDGVKPGEWGEGWTTSSLPLPLWTLWICLFTQTVMNFQLHGTEKSCTSPSVLGLELRRDALITMLLIFNEWKIKLYVHDKTLLLMLVYLGLWDYPQLICDWYKKVCGRCSRNDEHPHANQILTAAVQKFYDNKRFILSLD